MFNVRIIMPEKSNPDYVTPNVVYPLYSSRKLSKELILTHLDLVKFD